MIAIFVLQTRVAIAVYALLNIYTDRNANCTENFVYLRKAQIASNPTLEQEQVRLLLWELKIA